VSRHRPRSRPTHGQEVGIAVTSGLIRSALWAIAAAILAAILVLSLGSAGAPGGFAFADKLWHALAYAALTASVLMAARRPISPWWIVAGAAVLGGIVELVQGLDLFATRQPDVWDAVADAAGALIGLWVWRALLGRLRWTGS
jgi:VanZ family protein